MLANDRINVVKYLKDLNDRTREAIIYGHIKKEYVKFLNCKELAELCELTPATISNLTTCSKFYVLHKVASEIMECYYAYFMYDESKYRNEYPDELIYPRDINYVLMTLTTYYTEEWLGGF